MPTLKEYSKFQKSTEVENTFDLQYMALGLGGEVGEVQNEVKKYIRDDKGGTLTVDRKMKIMLELGDVMWYLNGLCDRIGCSIDEILQMNINKLKSKMKDNLKRQQKPQSTNLNTNYDSFEMMQSEL